MISLTPEEVDMIRCDLLSGKSQTETAKKFAVARNTIQKIINGKTWAHHPEPRPFKKNYLVTRSGVFSVTTKQFLTEKNNSVKLYEKGLAKTYKVPTLQKRLKLI